MNKIFFDNGMNHDLTDEELKLLRLLVAEHAREVADKYNIDLKAVSKLKVLFCEYLD